MTIKELIDIFNIEYRLQADLRKLSCQKLEEKVLVFWISEAEADIIHKVKTIINTANITLPAGATDGTLNNNIGQIISVRNGQQELKVIPINDLLNYYVTTELQAISIYNDGTGQKYRTNYASSSDITLTLWYHLNSNYYSASDPTDAQDYGTFSKTTLDGSLTLPDRYSALIKLYLMSKVLGDDYYMKYEIKLRDFNWDSDPNGELELPYCFGGITN